jgi:hypothetical protein
MKYRAAQTLAVRAWAPRHHMSNLHVPLTHDYLATIGGLTPEGRLFLQTQKQSYHSADVVRFLRVLLRKVSVKVLPIGDGAPIHHGQLGRTFTNSIRGRLVHW